MAAEPKVTVLMSVYNGERYLQQAVESILGQSFEDFEFLVVDDASSDRSSGILNGYRDPRLRILRNEANAGLAASLNRGIDHARGRYVARMDDDDVSLPERLERQVSFLDERPAIGVCGTWARAIDENGKPTELLRTPTGNAAGKLCWRPPVFVHPTVMARKELLRANRYDPAYLQAQDYELWLRLWPKTGFDNLGSVLLLYRSHGSSLTAQARTSQLERTYEAFSSFLWPRRVSYESFLALLLVEVKVNPLKRFAAYLRASAKTGISPAAAVDDNWEYLRRWARALLKSGQHGYLR